MTPYFSLIKILYQLGFLKRKGILQCLSAYRSQGINLMTLLHYHQLDHGDDIALQTHNDVWTFQELYQITVKWKHYLNDTKVIRAKEKVVIISHNSPYMLMCIVALTSLGVNIILLNADKSAQQLQTIIDSHSFQHILCDEHTCEKLETKDIISLDKIHELISLQPLSHKKLPRQSAGQLTVMSGGSSGRVTLAQRQNSIKPILQPFIALIQQIQIHQHKSLMLAIPMYHGFGIAAAIVCLVLGKKLFLYDKGSTINLADTIQQNDIDVITLVPTILQRLLDSGNINSLKCIISGGAKLPIGVVEKTLDSYGLILYNLYGTSEAGFCCIATPDDLVKYPDTIGQLIPGVKHQIISDHHDKNTGILHIHCSWMMQHTDKWMSTGDVVHINEDNYLFIKGRQDDMIVSGGENVFPESVESQCRQCPEIVDIVILPLKDKIYGECLCAFVVTQQHSDVIRNWMKGHLARYEMPRHIVCVESIPYYQNGKIDRASLWSQATTILS